MNIAGANYCDNCDLHIDGPCPACGAQTARFTRSCTQCSFEFSTPNAEASLKDLRSRQGTIGTESPVYGRVSPRFRSSAIDCRRCHRINELGSTYCSNCGLSFDSTSGFRKDDLGDKIPAYLSARPGGFWVRLVAFFIDGIVTTAAVSLLLMIFTDISPAYYMAETDTSNPTAEFINWTFNIAYAPILLGIWSTTIGKRAFNVYVLRPDGSPVGFWRALGREVAKIISFIPFGAGFWLIAFRQDRRGLHDLIAGTVVVQR